MYVIHRLLLYLNSSMWLDMQDAPSQDRNQPNFMSGWWYTPEAMPATQHQLRNLHMY